MEQLPLFPKPQAKPSAPMSEQPPYSREYCPRCKREMPIFWKGRAFCAHCDTREVFGDAEADREAQG